MVFKDLNIKTIILIAMAVLIILMTILSKLIHHESIPQEVIPTAIEPIQLISTKSQNKETREMTEEDSQSIKEMKEQMDSDRLQQKKIKMLRMQLEQTNLKLEEEKALSEIGKLEKENAGVVNDSNNDGQDKYPDIKVIYIGGTPESKEAILSINGNNYSVKEKNRPVKNVEVLSITDMSVTVHFMLPQELTTTIDYRPE